MLMHFFAFIGLLVCFSFTVSVMTLVAMWLCEVRAKRVELPRCRVVNRGCR